MGPRILISCDPEPNLTYFDAVAAAGGHGVIRYCPRPDLSYDGLVLAGGGDVHPTFYGQPNRGSYGIDRERDEAEFALLRTFLAADKPVLGICRGHQLINVELGGTLVQHIGDELALLHRRDLGSTQDKVHPVRAAEGSWYRETYGAEFPVNSSHHQVVDAVGKGLYPVLWADSGLIEGMEHESHRLISVQFHPERMCGDRARPDAVDGAAIFTRFLQMCRQI